MERAEGQTNAVRRACKNVGVLLGFPSALSLLQMELTGFVLTLVQCNNICATRHVFV